MEKADQTTTVKVFPVTKKALVTGITGQDGAYITELLLKKGYEVHGVKRRSSSFNTSRVDRFYEDPLQTDDVRFFMHYGDMTDSTNLIRLMQEVQPDEIYNLAAQSHVQVSFETPEYTANADGIGALRILEAMRILKMEDSARFYQASTSELFGATPPPQSETTPFYPRSPYAAAKLYAYWITVNYREAYGMHASNGILFNHESPLRGETFVTRKITRAVAAIELGLQDTLFIGNLDARRDWGHARDYVEGMWRIVQHDTPGDFVLGTGKSASVRDFIEASFAAVKRDVEWRGSGLEEVGIDPATGKTVVAVDPKYFRPTEVDHLLADPTKAKEVLGWTPKITLGEMVAEMVASDLDVVAEERQRVQRDAW